MSFLFKRAFLLSATVLSLLVGAFMTYMYFRQADGTVKVRVTRGIVDSALASHFPKEKTYGEVVRVTYSNPRVEFIPDANRVRVALDARVALGLGGLSLKSYDGSITFNTRLGYDAESHHIMLEHPQVEALEIPKLKGKYRDLLVEGANSVSGAWDMGIPVYEIKGKDLPRRAALLWLRRVEVEDGALFITLGL